jgi:hypothetical protein
MPAIRPSASYQAFTGQRSLKMKALQTALGESWPAVVLHLNERPLTAQEVADRLTAFVQGERPELSVCREEAINIVNLAMRVSGIVSEVTDSEPFAEVVAA